MNYFDKMKILFIIGFIMSGAVFLLIMFVDDMGNSNEGNSTYLERDNGTYPQISDFTIYYGDNDKNFIDIYYIDSNNTQSLSTAGDS